MVSKLRIIWKQPERVYKQQQPGHPRGHIGERQARDGEAEPEQYLS